MKQVRSLVWILGWMLVGKIGWSQCTLTFSGRVLDDHTLEPLAYASLYIEDLNQTLISDSLGHFQVSGLCPGVYRITVSHIYCQPVKTQINLRKHLSRDFLLHHQKDELETVEVRGKRANATQVMAQVNATDVAISRGQHLAAVLAHISGVRLLSTGSTIAKPVIHGLHGNRILLLNNGVRQEGQQWGAEHAPEIDPYVADKFSVIKGAAAVRYGSDAIAGVVMVTPRPLPRKAGLQGEVNLAAFSNNGMGVANAMAEQALGKDQQWAWRLQATGKRGGNSRMPGYWLGNTGVAEFNYSAAAGYRAGQWQTDVFFSAFNTRVGLFPGAHVETIDDLNRAIAAGKPLPSFEAGFSYQIGRPYQQVKHYLGKINTQYNFHGGSRLSLVLAHQENFRDEFDARAFIELPEMSLNLGTTTADVVWDYQWGGQHKLQTGWSAMRQENVNGAISARQFIRNYISWNGGAFALWQTTKNQWDVEAGMRYDYRWFESFYRVPGSENILVHNRTFSNATASLGVAHRLSSRLKLKTNIATAWRPPAPNELYANGLHQGLASIEIGNPDFAAERALNTNLELEYHPDSSWFINLTAYHNRINHFIYLAPTPPPQLTIRGFYPVFTYRQTQASLTGVDINAGYRFTGLPLQLDLQYAALYARNRTARDWLIFMPANHLEISLSYLPETAGKRFGQHYGRISLAYTERQRRIPNPIIENDYALPPPGYLLVHTDWGITSLKNGIQWGLSIQNLLNSRFRDYLNRLRYFADEAGINIQISSRIPIKST